MRLWRPRRSNPKSAELAESVLKLFARKYFGFVPNKPAWRIPTRLQIRRRDGHLVPLIPNPVQCTYELNRTSRNIILKARQTGITTYIAARYFLNTILIPGTESLQVAHSLESAQQIFRIVHRYFESLEAPSQKWLRVARSNVRELAFGRLDSRYVVDTAGNPNAGRGLTVHNLHASEVALWPGDPHETMAALLAAVPPGGNVDIESTPNGAAGYFYAEWLRAKAGEGFTYHFFPWWMEQAYELDLLSHETLEPFAEDEQHLVRVAGLRPEQIKYRRQLRAQFGILAAQEYAETDAECFLLSGRPVFEITIIEERLRRAREPLASRENGAELIWLPPERGRTYVIGADVGEGKEDGDYSAAVVLDAEKGLQCAELMVKWPVHRFAEALDRLGRTYNHAHIAVERNNHGHAVLESLQHLLHYPHIYRHEDSRHNESQAQFGWPTNVQTKPQAIGVLDRMLREAPEVFHSKRLLEQCRGYSYDDRGSTGALAGSHDDLVMAMAIALAVRASTRPVELFALRR